MRRRLPIDADVLALAAAAPPITDPHHAVVIAIWRAAIHTSKKVVSCSNS